MNTLRRFHGTRSGSIIRLVRSAIFSVSFSMFSICTASFSKGESCSMIESSAVVSSSIRLLLVDVELEAQPLGAQQSAAALVPVRPTSSPQ